MAEWQFYIETFGCKVNQHESQLLREAWIKLGGRECQDPQEASHICINSCAITERAERDARNAVYRLRKLSPRAKIVFTGCAAQFYEKSGAKPELSQIDLCVPQKRKAALLGGFSEAKSEALYSWGQSQLSSYNRSRPVVKVQDGCSQNCSFCIVPKTRGEPVSRPFSNILRECMALVKSGFCEIVLSGINLRQYEENSKGFWHLLAKLDAALASETDGLRLRISSLEPSMLGREALETLEACKLLAPHLHISLQHASPRILKKMGRATTKPDKILDFFEHLAKLWPNAAIGADILVGFPGEQEADIKLLENFIEASALTYAHVFPYSPRPGAAAVNFSGLVSHADKMARAALIRKKIEDRRKKFILEILQLSAFSVVFDKAVQNGKIMRGVNEYYIPCYLEGVACPCKIVRARPVAVAGNGIKVELL